MKRLCRSTYPLPPPPHRSISEIHREKSLLLTTHSKNTGIPDPAFLGPAHPSIMRSPGLHYASPPVPAPLSPRTPKGSTSNVLFPAPRPPSSSCCSCTCWTPQEHADVQSSYPKEKKRLSPVRLKAGRGSQKHSCAFSD